MVFLLSKFSDAFIGVGVAATRWYNTLRGEKKSGYGYQQQTLNSALQETKYFTSYITPPISYNTDWMNINLEFFRLFITLF